MGLNMKIAMNKMGVKTLHACTNCKCILVVYAPNSITDKVLYLKDYITYKNGDLSENYCVDCVSKSLGGAK